VLLFVPETSLLSSTTLEKRGGETGASQQRLAEWTLLDIRLLLPRRQTQHSRQAPWQPYACRTLVCARGPTAHEREYKIENAVSFKAVLYVHTHARPVV
jgi:hypothetical protein